MRSEKPQDPNISLFLLWSPGWVFEYQFLLRKKCQPVVFGFSPWSKMDIGFLNIHPGLHWKAFATGLRQSDWWLGRLESLVGWVATIIYYSLPFNIQRGLSVIYHHYLPNVNVPFRIFRSPFNYHSSGHPFGNNISLEDLVCFDFSNAWRFTSFFGSCGLYLRLFEAYSTSALNVQERVSSDCGWKETRHIWTEILYSSQIIDITCINMCISLICLSVYLEVI